MIISPPFPLTTITTTSTLKRPSRHGDDFGTVVLHGSNNDNDNHEAETDASFVRTVRDAAFLERTKHWVVLVDDEEAIRLAVGDYLYERGYQVTACADADALLEVLHVPNDDDDDDARRDVVDDGADRRMPAAIVSDVRMPGKDGLELLRLLRADERLSRVPVILLTAKSLTRDRIAGYRAGADVYLPKPFDPEELLSMLDNAVRRRRQIGRGATAALVDLKHELGDVRRLLERNAARVVRDSDVYLTKTEREVLEFLCRGCSNGEIAEERGVNVVGVNRCVQTLYTKTATRSRTELVRWALTTGQVSRRGG